MTKFWSPKPERIDIWRRPIPMWSMWFQSLFQIQSQIVLWLGLSITWCIGIGIPFTSNPELAPINSVICEQTFSFANHYTNLKFMNAARHKFFWLYVLDLHNHYVEDPRVQKVNPLSPVRMHSILETLLIENIKKCQFEINCLLIL